MASSLKQHWENIYLTRKPEEVSWTQVIPAASLTLIETLKLSPGAAILDVGGGDSRLTDFLLDRGYQNLTVLDISGAALERAKKRLGWRAASVHWIESDILNFRPKQKYELWHDRATFHFLMTPQQTEKYLSVARKAVDSWLILGTFSLSGPEKCSGLPVNRYDEKKITSLLEYSFRKIRCITDEHVTPAGQKQPFLFCSFRKINQTSPDFGKP